MTTLTRRQIVLDLEGTNEHEGTAYFNAPVEDDDERPDVSLFTSIETFREMGMPTQITVTIEPGDRLNDAIQE